MVGVRSQPVEVKETGRCTSVEVVDEHADREGVAQRRQLQ